MCGICGFIDGQGRGDETLLATMADRLVHRGPDEVGLYVDKGVGLANRRLSIVDLAGGRQPISNEDGSVVLVFNGEIYNQAVLRRQLEDLGHIFATASDTEVIVHLYEEWGIGGIERLNGMFAFALWDKAQQRGYLVRDRLGIKPLYYAQRGQTLVFGSEIKALLVHPKISPELDLAGLDLYLDLRYLPAQHSIFQGIHKLLPGHLLSFGVDGCPQPAQAYWQPVPAGSPVGGDPLVLADELLALLRDAVEMRLMSDVPFGAFLSGGLDSSAVVALMSQVMDQPVNAFSIGFSEEERLDERTYARMVAQECGAQHREVDSTAADVELLPRLIYHFDEPFADPIIVPTFQVAELARQHVKVVLTGEGADEVFGGYSRFVNDGVLRQWQRFPAGLWRVLAQGIGRLPGGGAKHQLDRALQMLGMADAERFLAWVRAFGPNQKEQLYGGSLRRAASQRALDLYQECIDMAAEASVGDQMLYCDLKLRLPECMLARTDRMTMAASIEGRTPFLDHRLVEFALGLPHHFKVRGKREKYLLKQALDRVLPAQIVQRRKQGLAVPFALWTREGLHLQIRRLLSPQRVKKRGFFAPEAVQHLVEAWGPEAGRHSQLVWSLLCFEVWCALYLDGQDPLTPLSQIQ